METAISNQQSLNEVVINKVQRMIENKATGVQATMEQKDIKTLENGLQYYRDWDNSEGGVVMVNPKTLNLYRKLRENSHPNIEDFNCFFAFGNEQFKQGYDRLVDRGCITDGDSILHYGAGLYGTQTGITKFLAEYDKNDKRIKAECAPQEVYFYEYNNHECMFYLYGDKEAYNLVVELFGEKVAKTIIRL